MVRQLKQRRLTAEQQALAEQWQHLPRHVLGLMAKRNALVRVLQVNDPDRLDSAANFGLCLAAQLFDPARGWKFSTYAVPVIMTRVKQELSAPFAAVRVPPCAWGSASTVKAARKACRPLGMDVTVRGKDGEARLLVDVLAERESEEPPWEDELQLLRGLVEGLSSPHREVLRMRFWEGMTLKEISARMNGVSKECIRQRLVIAVNLLRQAMEGSR